MLATSSCHRGQSAGVSPTNQIFNRYTVYYILRCIVYYPCLTISLMFVCYCLHLHTFLPNWRLWCVDDVRPPSPIWSYLFLPINIAWRMTHWRSSHKLLFILHRCQHINCSWYLNANLNFKSPMLPKEEEWFFKNVN